MLMKYLYNKHSLLFKNNVIFSTFKKLLWFTLQLYNFNLCIIKVSILFQTAFNNEA